MNTRFVNCLKDFFFNNLIFKVNLMSHTDISFVFHNKSICPYISINITIVYYNDEAECKFTICALLCI